MLTRGASARQRLIEAIRRHFRDYGGSPSYAELEAETGILKRHLARLLREIEADGLIILLIGIPRGIRLPRRAEMLSDSELQLEARARGFAMDRGTDLELPLSQLIGQIDDADKGWRRYGEAAEPAGEGGQPERGAPALSEAHCRCGRRDRPADRAAGRRRT